MDNMLWNTINKYLNKDLIRINKHPNKDLFILNYTEKVQYENLWDDFLLQARGLVVNSSGRIIAQPFHKFFNYEEVINKNIIPWDDEYVYIQSKMDGSLGILFFYEDEWIMSTRGSFTSEQSQRGMEILKSKYDLDKFVKEFTYLCEIIYPENRIVVNYNEEKIVFLSIIAPEGELNWITAKAFFHSSDIEENDIVDSVMATFTKETFDDYKQLNIPNEEGFVIRFYPSNFRMKIKFEEYVRLHKIMTNLSTTSVWEVLSNGNSMDDLLKDVPDEFYEKIKSYIKDLRYGFMSIQEHAGKLFDAYYESTDGFTNVSKKDFACWVFNQQKHIQPILFNMWDKKKYDHIIWRLLKPEFRKL
jgi:RNA ligase